MFPQLLRLKCGVTLCSYGRPVLKVRATKDPSGMVWEKPYELMPAQECWPRSCFYTEMLPLSNDTAMLAYSDFSVPDKDGIKRKSIMVRTIRVDSD